MDLRMLSRELSLYLEHQVRVGFFGSGVGFSLILGFSVAYACLYLSSIAKVSRGVARALRQRATGGFAGSHSVGGSQRLAAGRSELARAVLGTSMLLLSVSLSWASAERARESRPAPVRLLVVRPRSADRSPDLATSAGTFRPRRGRRCLSLLSTPAKLLGNAVALFRMPNFDSRRSLGGV